jgi:hypothetical protein
MKLPKIFLIAALSVSAVLSARATVIYDEAVSGDLPGDQNHPVEIGTLGVGVNSVLGTASFASDGGGGQGDTFWLKLLAGDTITAISLSIFNDTTTAGDVALTTFRGNFLDVEQTLGTQGSSLYTFTPLASQPAGDYGFSDQFRVLDGGSFQYRWDVTVAGATVPEAGSTLALLGLALAGCAGLRRRLVG